MSLQKIINIQMDTILCLNSATTHVGSKSLST